MAKISISIFTLLILYTPITEILDARLSIASGLLEKAMFSEQRGCYKEAEFYIESGLNLLSIESSFIDKATYYKKMGVIKWHLGRVAEAQEYFDKALVNVCDHFYDGTTSFCEKALNIITYYQKAKKARLEGKIDESSKLFFEAISLARTVSNGELAGKCYRQLAVNLWEQNKLEDYLTACVEALKLSVLSRNRKETGICCNNLGLYYWKNSSLSLALFFIKEGLDLSRMEEADDNISICLSNLGVLYFELGDFSNSLKAIQETIKLEDNKSDLIGRTATYNNLGLLYKNEYIRHRDSSDAQNAVRAFSVALSNSRVEEKIKILNNLGQIYTAMGQYELAFQVIDTCMQLLNKKPSSESDISVRNSLGFYYLETRAISKAAMTFNRIIASNTQKEFCRDLWESHFGWGECWLAMGQYERAIDCYKKAINEIDKTRNEIYYDLQKVSYRRDKIRVYERTIEALLRKYKITNSQSDAAAIISFIEKTKSEALRESMEKAVDLNSIYARIWLFIKDEYLTKQPNTIIKGVCQIETIVCFAAINALRHHNRIDLEEKTITIKEIIAYSIQHKQNIVEYYFSGDTSLIITVKNGRVSVDRFLQEKILKSRIEGYLAFLSSQKLPVEVGYKKAQSIFIEILAPYIELDRKKVTNLIIIPAGCLCELPFEALVTGGTVQKPEYLVHHFSITYMPSISIALMLERKQRNKKTNRFEYVAFGDPRSGNHKVHNEAASDPKINQQDILSRLPRSRQEVIFIGKHFKRGNRLIFTGNQASEDNFRRMNGIPITILHIACHSIIDYMNPQNSRLILSHNKLENYDGEINVDEIYELNLPVSLVLLSSCQTARGLTDDYEGTLGFIRAFFVSGTNSVISTLWRINDEAAFEFVQLLFKRLLTGCDLADALRNAKVTMLVTKYRHPAYWAAFVLHGGVGVSL